VDAATGEGRVVLGTDAFFEIYDLEWSPDGSRLAVLHHPVEPPSAALLTIGADGTGVRMVALCENGDDTDGLCPPNGGEVVWSPDGRSLLFDNYATADFPWGEERRTLVRLNLDTHAVTPLSVGLDHGCCIASQPGDSPDRSL
jgi:Tol biopolymer transport system component